MDCITVGGMTSGDWTTLVLEKRPPLLFGVVDSGKVARSTPKALGVAAWLEGVVHRIAPSSEQDYGPPKMPFPPDGGNLNPWGP